MRQLKDNAASLMILLLILAPLVVTAFACGGVSKSTILSAPIPADRPVDNTAKTTSVSQGKIPFQAYDARFPLGVFEDGHMLNGDSAGFQTMIRNLQAHHLDAVMFTNNVIDRDAPLLDVSDELGMPVFMLPAGDLNESWWPDEIPANIEMARTVARPAVRQFGSHPSFKGYIVKDEPRLDQREKVALLTQAYQELDPARPVTPILIGIDRVGPIFATAQPDVMLIDVYPLGHDNAPCDFTLTGFGYSTLDFVNYIRLVTKAKPADTPLWMILQTHSFGDDGAFALRAPTTTEVRLQHWLAIGEGATGIFWFVYSSQQGWIGLADNPDLFAEVATLAQRIDPLREVLLGIRKGPDQFTVSGGGQPYVSTLVSLDGALFYAVVVNRDCVSPHKLSISSETLSGRLKDRESGQVYDLNTPISFRPGDGKLFELIPIESE
jgi:hypothetical protein